MKTDRFTSRLGQSDDYRRQQLIDRIEHAVGRLSLPQLEALAYDMFAKGYLDE